jgi:hypothetical protein
VRHPGHGQHPRPEVAQDAAAQLAGRKLGVSLFYRAKSKLRKTDSPVRDAGVTTIQWASGWRSRAEADEGRVEAAEHPAEVVQEIGITRSGISDRVPAECPDDYFGWPA